MNYTTNSHESDRSRPLTPSTSFYPLTPFAETVNRLYRSQGDWPNPECKFN